MTSGCWAGPTCQRTLAPGALCLWLNSDTAEACALCGFGASRAHASRHGRLCCSVRASRCSYRIAITFLLDCAHRFSAEFREYKYLIAHTPGMSDQAQPAQQQQRQEQQQQDVQQAAAQQAQQGTPPCELDVEAMRRAAAFFIGEHDFRNFCKVGLGLYIYSLPV